MKVPGSHRRVPLGGGLSLTRRFTATWCVLAGFIVLFPSSGFAQDPPKKESAPTDESCVIRTDTGEFPCDYEGPIGSPPPGGNEESGAPASSSSEAQIMSPGSGCVVNGDKPYKSSGIIKGHGEMVCPNSHYRVGVSVWVMRERWFGWESFSQTPSWFENVTYYRVGGTQSIGCPSGTWTYAVYGEGWIKNSSGEEWLFVAKNDPDTEPTFRTTC